jgi:hypothetical protein
LCCRIDVDVPHQGQVDDQPAVVAAESRRTVAAPAHGEIQVVLASEIDCRHDVGNLLGANHCTRAPVEHAVVYGAGLVVVGIIRRDHRTTQLLSQLVDSHRATPVRSSRAGHRQRPR